MFNDFWDQKIIYSYNLFIFVYTYLWNMNIFVSIENYIINNNTIISAKTIKFDDSIEFCLYIRRYSFKCTQVVFVFYNVL